ncbi:phage tail tape measure protein [Lactococcus petauri]|uniref:phage tail tape measure protein n=1 Tax=Lactococcus petauri TaxID=1940789 RepID=UPI00288DE979|nr:phage tail tape measure protein [Lactococcus petauri]MDT2594344.1 phage tail tape measure protein [Lactococcus petauri]
MESFSVQAYLKATDNNFVSTFKDAAKQVENFQKNTNSTMSAVGKVMTSSGKAMTKMVTLPIVGMGVAAAKVGGDFEEQMSRVKAISGATGKSFDALRQQAIDLGAKTAFSAKESAAGMENLASAGFDASEIMQAMPGLLDLAAVSGGDVALASENAATALRGFNLDASQAGHVADVFARAAADTNAEVADMGEAMKYIAPVANAMGLSIEEVSAAIGIMSDAGIKGSQAGTSLRGALSRLAKPTKPMIGVMNDLGLSFYDAEGKMKPLKDQIGMLKDAFKGLTPEQQQNALVTLYGQESLSGMMALIDKGPEKLGSLTKSLKDSDGAADKMARTMQDNMNSSLEQMMGALESAAIVIQKVMAPSIRKIADAISGLVDMFVSAPEPVQKLAVTIALIVAAIGPLLFIFGQVVVTLQRVKVGFTAIQAGLALMGTSVTGVILPVLGIVAAIAAVIAIGVLVYKNWDKISKFGKEMWANVKKFASDAAEAIKKKWGDITQWFSDTWNNLKNGAKGLWDGTIQGAKDAIDSVKNAWNGIKEWFANLWKGTTSGLASAWDSVTTTLAPFVEAIKTIFQPILEFFSGLWGQVQTIFGSAWEIIKTVVMGPVLLLIDLITGDFNQFKEDFAMLWQTLATAIQTIVQTFVNIVVGFYSSFFQTVVNIWTTIVNTIQSLWGAFTTWVVNMAKSIVDGIVNGWNSFKQGTVDLWNATIQWVKDTWASFKQWIVDSANAIVNGVKQGWENLKQGTIDLWNGMVNGLKGIWDGLKQSVSDLIDNVVNIFNTLKNINLLDIGKAIIDGFVNGLKSAWEAGMKFISGIGDWIREHKGPIRVDRKLLIPAGNAIMGGLNKGLNNSFKTVQNSVLGMNDFLANAINAGGSVNIGTNIRNANNSIGGTIAHEVNLNKGKQPAQINIRLGKQELKAFVEDINQVQGWEIAKNNLF